MLLQRASHQQLARARPCCSCPQLPALRSPLAARPIHSAPSSAAPRLHQQQQQQQAPRHLVRAQPEQQQQGEGERPVVYNTEFGYSRKDVLIIIVALLAAGILMYEGLKAAGMDAGMAGNWVQLVIFLGICVGWVSTYIYRVATKNMTYAKQLEMYESAVIEKRLEEMTEAEVAQLMDEVEQDKARGADKRFRRNTTAE